MGGRDAHAVRHGADSDDAADLIAIGVEEARIDALRVTCTVIVPVSLGDHRSTVGQSGDIGLVVEMSADERDDLLWIQNDGRRGHGIFPQ